MKSIKTKITLLTVIAIAFSAFICILLGINGLKSLGKNSSDEILSLLSETGEKNLNYYFKNIEQSVNMVSSYAENDLEKIDESDLGKHLDNVNDIFYKIAEQTDGVLTYYYRIDPDFSTKEKGFWYINVKDSGFTEHEVTDITQYDTTDTSELVWFTVPKVNGTAIWLPPYNTENLGAYVLSYNVPVYKHGTFVGVIGIEIDYSTMASQVDNITIHKSGYAYINNDKGEIIYHPKMDIKKYTGGNMPKVPDGLLSKKKFINYTFDGVEKRAAWKKLSNGMRLNVTVPVSEINDTWTDLLDKLLIVCLIILATFIFVAMYVADMITRPLEELTKAAKEVDKGNYDIELIHQGDDEVGTLSYSFSQLIAHLKERIEEINTLNEALKEDNLTLEAATIRDSLTGVKNRFALRRDYDNYSEQDIHIMMFDLDDFKSVNDIYGHSVGDYLLKQTGDSLIECFGAPYSYRYGGDEFLVIVPDMSEEDFKNSIMSLEKRLSEIFLEDKSFPVKFSAGYVYGKTLLQDDLRLMLRQADELLYESKQSGKNTFRGQKYDREAAELIKKKAEEMFRHG